jgi:hypothetical protein
MNNEEEKLQVEQEVPRVKYEIDEVENEFFLEPLLLVV